MKKGFMNRMVENKKGINRDAIKYIAVVAIVGKSFCCCFPEFRDFIAYVFTGDWKFHSYNYVLFFSRRIWLYTF